MSHPMFATAMTGQLRPLRRGVQVGSTTHHCHPTPRLPKPSAATASVEIRVYLGRFSWPSMSIGLSGPRRHLH
jgi:hypothetical protein